jgi:uncharacterized protein (TIGR02996 family)
MPFTDEQPFLDAIFARYHADEPRFIYADFLDDAGDPDRAELVRVQVALARMTDDDPNHAEIKNKEVELLEAHRPRWCDYVSDLVSPAQCEFRRGVLDAVVLDAAQFLEKGEELFRRVPLRRISLRDSEDVMADLMASPLFTNVHELDFNGNSIGNGGVNLLVRSPFLKDLHSLDLSFTRIDDSGVAILARAGTLPNLTSLSLSLNDLTSASIGELAASPFFGGLTVLDISYNQVDAVGVQAIAASKTLTRLHTLRLSENRIGDAGIEDLARSSLFERLLSRSSRLELRRNEIGPSGAAVLAQSPQMSKCTSLDLSINEIGDRGITSILESKNLQSLRVLRVGHNKITDKAGSSLRKSLKKLHFLDLSHNKLSSQLTLELTGQAERIGTVRVDVSYNNHSSVSAEPPNPIGDVVQGYLQGVSDRAEAEQAEAEQLRRRVAHPNLRRGERPNPPG